MIESHMQVVRMFVHEHHDTMDIAEPGAITGRATYAIGIHAHAIWYGHCQ
jgi:hypothetical protein